MKLDKWRYNFCVRRYLYICMIYEWEKNGYKIYKCICIPLSTAIDWKPKPHNPSNLASVNVNPGSFVASPKVTLSDNPPIFMISDDKNPCNAPDPYRIENVVPFGVYVLDLFEKY